MTHSPNIPKLSPMSDDMVAQLRRQLGSTNGRGSEWVRYLVGLVLAAIVAYFTAQGQTKEAIGKLDERENNHFAEVLRRLDSLVMDVRDIRNNQP